MVGILIIFLLINFNKIKQDFEYRGSGIKNCKNKFIHIFS